MLSKLFAVALATLAILFATSAEARTRHQTEEHVFDRHSVSGSYNYGPVIASPRTDRIKQKRAKKVKTVKVRHTRVVERTVERGEVQLLPHPSGCPSRSFCGCGAAIEVFGRNIRELWLARNWFKFPVAEPAPGMVAVRRHHVFTIRKVLGPGRVLAVDHNSGGHKSRLWQRSLRGYSVRNPSGSKYASAE